MNDEGEMQKLEIQNNGKEGMKEQRKDGRTEKMKNGNK